MKKVFLVGCILFLCGCSSLSEENIDALNNNVEIEFLTKEPNFDKITISYFIDNTRPYSLNSYTFSYDENGDPLPLKITLENYTSKIIDGEAFRENHSPAELSVKLYVNGQLILEDASKGTAETFATVKFNYTIPD
ncbi:hypothetical protein K8354_12445 [Polaribacter litorisediminis]|uniref:hypothetical protein n=1 Tax=Polaribacter litorisediminis TaxID=1908341 RepID=UPI001CBCDD9F|nr:hypothetical protein [Polaribacter litorisediminis]UAM97127.1 hypothetical protein K8354_12445 [Polaribacter litorisediminis]